MVTRKAVRRSIPVGELPDFTPVPRRHVRHDGWTVARQKAFIEALADTGCVAIAARMVNMSQVGVYQLRRQPGAESFRAAMDAAQTLGLQPVKDEAFDRAMNGQLVPVFVAGKLMGFRRKKNDRLLMFILRHYGQDAQGRKTTINYFSTRASAGAGATQAHPAADPSAVALAKAEASTTTVKTVISGPGHAPTQLAADESAANILNAFAGVPLDPEAQAEIHRTLEACAERRRALEDDPENDPDCALVRVRPGDIRYLGELESGCEGDWVEYRPEGEHRWEGLGEGGEAERIDAVLDEMKRAREEAAGQPPAAQPEAQAALPAPDVAPSPDPLGEHCPELVEAPPDSGDPRLDCRNWTDGGYAPPSSMPAHPEPACPGPRSGEGRRNPRREHKPRKPYKKRTPKPPFTPPEPALAKAWEARKAEAVAAVAAERSELAAAEAERRRRRKDDAGGDDYS